MNKSTRAKGRKPQDVSQRLRELRANADQLWKEIDNLSTDRRLTAEMRGQLRELGESIANCWSLLTPIPGHRVYVRRQGVRS